jgi:hypothetical protein
MLQVEDDSESRINTAHLFKSEIAHTAAESAGIDRRGLLSQHARDAAIDLDLRTKACRTS